MDLQFLGFLRPFYMYNNNLYPKSSRNYVLLRAGLNKAGQSCPFGQKGWIGRPWLARPSKGHNFWNFLGINSYSTRKKVSNKPKFGGPLIFEHFKSRSLKSEHNVQDKMQEHFFLKCGSVIVLLLHAFSQIIFAKKISFNECYIKCLLLQIICSCNILGVRRWIWSQS